MLTSTQVARPGGLLGFSSGSPTVDPHGVLSDGTGTTASSFLTHASGADVSRYTSAPTRSSRPVSAVQPSRGYESFVGSNLPGPTRENRGLSRSRKNAIGSFTLPSSCTP